MKKIATIGVFVLAASSFSTIASDTLTGCAAKKHNVQTQIDEAKKNGNAHSVAGLEKAYSELAAHCTDDSLRKEREEKVSDKEHKVAEREKELQEAKASGRTDKVAKKEKKLNEAREELREAKAELDK